MRLRKPRFFNVFLLLISVFGLGCGQKRAQDPHRHDTLVPQTSQREAERNMNEQQMMMQDLNMTTSEQAGSQHQQNMDRRVDRQSEDE